MSVFENIYTQVQVRPAEPDQGPEGHKIERAGPGMFEHWLGIFGNAQIGPIYLGTLGVLSLICGFMAFEIIGLNMLASMRLCSNTQASRSGWIPW